MKKELYLAKSEAHHYAEMFAEDLAGATVKDETSHAVASDATTFDYIDRDMNNVCWSGELAGYTVTDADGQLVGIFAYFDAQR